LAIVLLAASHLAWLPAALAQHVPVGPEFQVNTYTTSAQELPAVAPTNAGQFVVVWQSNGGSGTDPDFGIHARRYDNGGAPLGGQFQVNTYATSAQTNPAIAPGNPGSVV